MAKKSQKAQKTAAESSVMEEKQGSRSRIMRALSFFLLYALLLLYTPSLIMHAHALPRMQTAPAYISSSEKEKFDHIVVFGAGIRDQRPSPMLQDRLDTAYLLYEAGLAPNILLSGDYTPPYYDELSVMARYLEDRGVPAADLIIDRAGFSTFATVENLKRDHPRARYLFVTQAYHLPRALFIADRLGLDAHGAKTARNLFPGASLYLSRELLARGKDLLQIEFYLRNLDFSAIHDLYK